MRQENSRRPKFKKKFRGKENDSKVKRGKLDFKQQGAKGKLPINTIRVSGQVATLNLTPGKGHLAETRTIIGNKEYRIWDPKTSKLCAALHKGLDYPQTAERPIILYLGASFGNTISYLSDIYPNGIIYAVESAIEPLRQIALLSLARKNIIPLHEDANHPENYMDAVPQADIIYMDVAQKNQVQILKKNMIYSSTHTIIMFCVKARSIDVAMPPSQVFQKVRDDLKGDLSIISEIRLEPYEKDHVFMVMKKK